MQTSVGMQWAIAIVLATLLAYDIYLGVEWLCSSSITMH
jgi:hypothetical protein